MRAGDENATSATGGDAERSEQAEIERACEELLAWCSARDFAGHDPFDALNSRLFQSTPLRRSRLARLAWTQLFKRSPVSLRGPALVPASKNPKGTALFALAALARFRGARTKEYEGLARRLLDDLLSSRVEGWGGAAWGYNFDWQGRAFFAPKGTPTVVPSAFAVRALTEAAVDLGDESYLNAARGACEFILRGLNRTEETDEEVCWSYSPLDHTRVFNASLLAAEALASVGALTGESDLKAWAVRGARYVARRQSADGSWAYGAEGFQSWSDNFHTAFILTSLARIIRTCKDTLPVFDGAPAELDDALRRGYEFWRQAFFLEDARPRYYHDRDYPSDAHSAGAAVVALLELADLDASARDFARRVALWAIRNLRDPRGFFYYQRGRFYTIRTPYMRWSQAWMLYALARLGEESKQ